MECLQLVVKSHLKTFLFYTGITGGTPFPLCPIGCSSNYPLGKRRLGEQPYYFSSSVIIFRYILFTAQESLREVQADEYSTALHHCSSMSPFSPFPKLYTYMRLSKFQIFILLIEGLKSLSWNCAYSSEGASGVMVWHSFFVLSDMSGGEFSHTQSHFRNAESWWVTHPRGCFSPLHHSMER